MAQLYFYDGISKISRNYRQWDSNPSRQLFKEPLLQVNQDCSREGMKPDFCPASPSTPGSLLWSTSVWIWLPVSKPGATRGWPAGQDVPAGLATALCCQTAWRAAEFSLMKWSINGVFLLCPAADFHKACESWYLWNISSAKLVRISLCVQNYWDRIWQTEILFASFL